MKTPIHSQLVKITRHAIVPAVALALLAAPAANAALLTNITPGVGESFTSNVVITQGTTGNGSFEGSGSGTTFSWLGQLGGAIEAFGWDPDATDPIELPTTPEATDGTYSLRVSETGTGAASSEARNRRHNSGLDFVNGDVFHITFDYYVPSTDGYTLLVITPLTYTDTSFTTTGQAVVITPTSNVWNSVDLYWQLDADDEFDGFETRFQFRRSSPVGGTTYEGFIDNVVITQGVIIPEPSTLTLFALAALTCLGFRARNRSRKE